MDESPIQYVREKGWRSAKPFQPFTFELISGDRLDVLDALWYGGSDHVIGVYNPRDGMRHIKPKEVASIRLLDADEVRAYGELPLRRRA